MSLSLYFHLPFCIRKCRYCDFYSVNLESKTVRDYIKCCKREISRLQSETKKRHLRTIYFGGGTPSLFEPDLIAGLLNEIKGTFVIGKGCEITIEVNPSSLDSGRLKQWSRIGINRLSIGAQSFDDNDLKSLGRLHDSRQAENAIFQIKKSGWRNWGIDLIFGIPSQTHKRWKRTIEKALAWQPKHLSVYGLTVEKGTPLAADIAAGRITMPVAENYNRMFETAHRILLNAGYEHYEISNYALPGFRSRHNSSYWTGDDYLGIGAGAHSRMDDRRFANIADVNEYCKRMETGLSPIAFDETVTSAQRINETIMLGLRTAEGIDSHKLRQLDASFVEKTKIILDRIAKAGLIEFDGRRFKCTLKGMEVLDEIVKQLME